MKLEITTSVKNVQMANWLLAEVINVLRDHPERESQVCSDKDLDAAEAFRRSLLKAFLRPVK